MHSLLAKARLLYSHDESIAALFERLQVLGKRDTGLQLLAAASHAMPSLYKAHKWLVTRGDLDYTALWILYTADALAKIEVLEAGLLVDREVLPQALKLNPAFFQLDLHRPAQQEQDEDRCGRRSLRHRRIPPQTGHRDLCAGDRLSDGSRRSSLLSEIEHYFQRTFGIEGVAGACEYLADEGFIGKAPLPVRLTKRSNIQVNETAFFCGMNVADAW